MSEKLLNQQSKVTMKQSRLWGVFLFAMLLIVDQVTKLVADVYFNVGEEVALIDGWLWLTLTYNRGISYGIGATASQPLKIAVIVATAVIMILIAVMYMKVDKRRMWLKTAFVFVFSGGVGNLIDRVYYQVWNPSTAPFGVRDMVDLSRFGFGVCNFADFFIVAGAIIFVLAVLFFDKDAIFPMGKYKSLAKEYEEKNALKKKAKEEGK